MSAFEPEPRDRETLGALERSLPRVAPPDDMFDRILDEIRDEATVLPLRPRTRIRWAVASGLAAAAAAVVVAVGLTLSGGSDVDARATITGTSDPTIVGDATISGTALHVSLTGVPSAPSGHHYEVWVLPAGSTAMVSLGTFRDAGEVELDYPLPPGGRFAAVDVSVEEDAGPPAHSDTSLASGSFA